MDPEEPSLFIRILLYALLIVLVLVAIAATITFIGAAIDHVAYEATNSATPAFSQP